jgi:glycosyltransferase involved in cell wall biosynthesis
MLRTKARRDGRASKKSESSSRFSEASRLRLTHAIVFTCILYAVLDPINRVHTKSLARVLRKEMSSKTGACGSEATKPRSAVMTPYDLTPGGGERYLLEMVAFFQSFGHTVDLIAADSNVCHNVSCVMELARALRVQIDPDLLCVRAVKTLKIKLRRVGYVNFMLLGNEKVPQFTGMGRFNIYMCQFPFDLERAYDERGVRRLSSYQLVWLNSEYSWRWFNYYVWPQLAPVVRNFYEASTTRASWKKDAVLWPDVQVQYPPVTPLTCPTYRDSDRTTNCQSIVLLGRFFKGRQSKGHMLAVELLRSLVQGYPDMCVHLHMIGNQQPGHEAYTRLLRQYENELPLSIHLSVPASEIQRLLCSASVQWHLTGALLEEEVDPASSEHFGISVVEGMSAGVIPVVLNHGGTSEVVEDSYGRRVDDLVDYVHATVEIMRMKQSLRSAMRKRAVEAAASFSTERFSSIARRKVIRATMEQSFHKSVLPNIPFRTEPRKENECTDEGGCTCVITDFSGRPSLAAVIKNVRSELGHSWALVVVTAFPVLRIAVEATTTALGVTDMQMVSGFSSVHNVGDVPSLVAFSRLTNVRIVALQANKHMHSTTDVYSRMFTHRGFWKLLGSETILVFQTDSFIGGAGPSIKEFLGYDFVGAPWCEDNDVLVPLVAAGDVKYFVGNGGFSARKRSAMEYCIDEYSNTFDIHEPEDRFFIKCFSRNTSKFNVAPVNVARKFAIEVPCKEWKAELKSYRPFAFHATWYYMKPDDVTFLSIN